MTFDKQLAILYVFFNLRISKKTTLLEIAPMESKTFFEFLFDFISK